MTTATKKRPAKQKPAARKKDGVKTIGQPTGHDDASLKVLVVPYGTGGQVKWGCRIKLGTSGRSTPVERVAASEFDAVTAAITKMIQAANREQKGGTVKQRQIGKAVAGYLESVLVERSHSRPSSSTPGGSGKAAKRPAKKTKQTKSKALAVSRETLSIGEKVVRLKLTQLCRHADNRHPTPAAVAKLAGAIEQDGQLEPILVRQLGKKYQVLSGETRWLATAENGDKEIDARIAYDVDDSTALRIVATGNLRTDLNPIERARLCQRLTEPAEQGGGGMTQQQAGDMVGLSRSAVANSIRILNAPEWLQQLVSDGRLPETFARETLGVMENGEKLAQKAIKKLLPKTGPVESSRSEFIEGFTDELERATRCLEYDKPAGDWQLSNRQNGFSGCRFKASDEDLQKLKPIDVPGYKGWGKNAKLVYTQRATNVKLWGKLQTEADAKWREHFKSKSKSKPKKAKGADGKAAKPTAAELRKKKADADKRLAKQLHQIGADWLRYLIAAKLNAPGESPDDRLRQHNVVIKLLLWASTDYGGDTFDSYTSASNKFRGRAGVLLSTSGAPKKAAKRRDDPPKWAKLRHLTDDDLTMEAATKYVAGLFWLADEPMPMIPVDLVYAIAGDLKVDRLKHWKHDRCGDLTHRFFELHNRAQLETLAKAWSINDLDPKDNVGQLRARLINDKRTFKSLPKSLATKGGN